MTSLIDKYAPQQYSNNPGETILTRYPSGDGGGGGGSFRSQPKASREGIAGAYFVLLGYSKQKSPSNFKNVWKLDEGKKIINEYKLNTKADLQLLERLLYNTDNDTEELKKIYGITVSDRTTDVDQDQNITDTPLLQKLGEFMSSKIKVGEAIKPIINFEFGDMDQNINIPDDQKEELRLELLNPEENTLENTFNINNVNNIDDLTIISDATNKITIRHEIREAVQNFNIKETRPVEAPLYFILIKNDSSVGNNHVSIIIIINGSAYSIGLGYYGNTAKQQKINDTLKNITPYIHTNIAALYTQDFVIDPTKLTSKNVLHRYMIIDIGILNQDHLDRIQLYLNLTTNVIASIEHNLTRTKWHFDSLLLPLNSTIQYNAISNLAISSGNINCSSFVQNIFRESVSFGTIAAHPLLGKNKKGDYITAEYIDEIFSAYNASDIDKFYGLVKPTHIRKEGSGWSFCGQLACYAVAVAVGVGAAYSMGAFSGGSKGKKTKRYKKYTHINKNKKSRKGRKGRKSRKSRKVKNFRK